MQLGNITCWISVNGVQLEEYGVEEDNERKEYVAWIASEPEQSFSVNWRDPDRTRATAGNLFVDGVACGVPFLDAPRDESDSDEFGALELTDDDLYLKKDVKDIGQIELRLSRVNVGRKTEFRPYQLEENTKMHEKSKKGLQLAVKLGTSTTVRSKTCYKIDYIERLATFIFRYRTIEMLRANGIAPPIRSPSPAADIPVAGPSTASSSDNLPATSSSSSPAPVAGRKRRASAALTPDPEDVKPEIDLVAIDEAEERVRQIEEQYRRAKQELEQRRRNKKVKIEEITSFISGEVIDLTDD